MVQTKKQFKISIKTNNTMKKNNILVAVFAALSIAFSANAQVKIGANPTIISPNTNLEVEALNGQKVVVSKDAGNLGVGLNNPLYKFHTKETDVKNVYTGLVHNIQTSNVALNDQVTLRGLGEYSGGFSGAGYLTGFSGILLANGTANYSGVLMAGQFESVMNSSGTTNLMVGSWNTASNYGTGVVKTAWGTLSSVLATTGIVQNAVGLYINQVRATGIDPTNPHYAYAIKIDNPNEIVASGGSINKAWSFYSKSIQPSFYAGSVGIGTDAPLVDLQVQSTGTPNVYVKTTDLTKQSNLGLVDPNNNGWFLTAYAPNYGGVTEQKDLSIKYWNGTANVPVMHFTPNGLGGNGNVGIGNVAQPTERLQVQGNILASGTITPSDVRYKENIATLNGSLAKLTQLRGVSYTHKAEFIKSRGLHEGNQIGFIAQELEAVFPEFVVTSSDGYKAVDYSRLTPVLVESLKEVNAKLEAQQAEINELKAAVKQLMEKK
jgi:hypothetical protein